MSLTEYMDKVLKTLAYYNKKALILFRMTSYGFSRVKLQQPIFVVGCSRAGTTLIYKTLSESKYLGTLQKETHDFWAALHPIEEREWESHEIPMELACAKDRGLVSKFFYIQTGQRRIIDKNNQNGLSIPYLIKLFPDAHFIYIKRNAGDNINSLIHGWNKADEFATWSDMLPETVDIERGKHKRWCFFLAKGWRLYTKANIEDVCAFQYRAINEAILDAKGIVSKEKWHEISYETLISNPVEEFQKIFVACNIPFDNHLKQHCKEVLLKPYNTFSEIRVDKWKDGGNQVKIEKVLPSLNRLVKSMGY